MSTLKQLLSPPVFEDETKSHQAYILHYILLVLMVVPAAYSATIWFTEPGYFSAALMQSIFSETILGVVFTLNRMGKTYLASLLQIGFFWILFNGVSYTRLGVHGTAYILGNGTVIVVAGLLLGGRISLLTTFFSILAGSWMTFLDTTGARFINIQPDPSLRIWIICTILFLVINAVQYLSSQTIQGALTRAQASETRYRSLIENIPTITYINGLGPEAPTIYISPQVRELYGYKQEEFIKDPVLWKKILHPDDRERVLAENDATSENSEPFEMEYRLITKDDYIAWVHDKAILVRDHNGVPLYWLGVWTDITPRKRAEEDQAELVGAMTRRTIQLQTGTEVSRAASSILDLEELLPTVVELIRSHFGYYYAGIFLLNEAKTAAILKAATGEMGRVMLAEHHRLEVGESSMVGWCIAHRQARIALDVGDDAVHFKNPHLPLTRSEVALPLISRGEVIGAMTIQSEVPAAFSPADISSLQSMADHLANALENARLFAERSLLITELEKKNAELERFTYTVSHDLKSPLVTIRGFLGFLHDDAKARDMARFEKDLARIANAADRMQMLLNDLLELSRVGRIVNPPENIPFGQIASEAVELNAGALNNDSIQLEIHPDLPMVQGDRLRLVEVLQNLINNAVKFMGDQPTPRIEIGTRGIDEDGRTILFVRDNGIGIDPAHHERIFGLFNRLDPGVEGTGIGLTLAKRIIEVHGGRIWVESNLGEGASFLFSLPQSSSISARETGEGER